MICQQMLFVFAVLKGLDVAATRATGALVGPIHTKVSLVQRPDTLLTVSVILDFHGAETDGVHATQVRQILPLGFCLLLRVKTSEYNIHLLSEFLPTGLV